MDEPEYTGRPSATRLEGDSKQSILDQVEDKFTVAPNYDTVNVVDMPGFDDCFDYFLVNYYYTNAADPVTTLDCYRVYTDGKVEHA